MWGEKVYVPAIMGASGITKEQAKTCLYYAIATYFLPGELELMPILAIIGPHGTGKTDLLMQLRKMVNDPDVPPKNCTSNNLLFWGKLRENNMSDRS